MASGDQPLTLPPAPGAVLRRTGPRVARDGFGPLAAFFAGWKLASLGVGIAAAVAVAALLYGYERRRERPGMVVRLSLGLVAIRAIVGLLSGSVSTYLGQEIAIDCLLASAFLGSVILGRPLTAAFATEVYPLPPPLRGAPSYRRALGRIALVWGAYFLCRAAVRLLAFLTLSTDAYVLVVALSDVPFLIGLLAWSVWHARRRLEAEPAFAALVAG